MKVVNQTTGKDEDSGNVQLRWELSTLLILPHIRN